jgi:hypothetical protein
LFKSPPRPGSTRHAVASGGWSRVPSSVYLSTLNHMEMAAATARARNVRVSSAGTYLSSIRQSGFAKWATELRARISNKQDQDERAAAADATVREAWRPTPRRFSPQVHRPVHRPTETGPAAHVGVERLKIYMHDEHNRWCLVLIGVCFSIFCLVFFKKNIFRLVIVQSIVHYYHAL